MCNKVCVERISGLKQLVHKTSSWYLLLPCPLSHPMPLKQIFIFNSILMSVCSSVLHDLSISCIITVIYLSFSADDYTEGYMPALAMVQHDGHVFWPPIVKWVIITLPSWTIKTAASGKPSISSNWFVTLISIFGILLTWCNIQTNYMN